MTGDSQQMKMSFKWEFTPPRVELSDGIEVVGVKKNEI